MTDAERMLWRHLDGHKFRRQVRIGPCVADFACLSPLIVIEVDGGQRTEARAYDARRDDYMRGQGFRVLRFWNNDVLSNMEGVWDTILAEFRR